MQSFKDFLFEIYSAKEAMKILKVKNKKDIVWTDEEGDPLWVNVNTGDTVNAKETRVPSGFKTKAAYDEELIKAYNKKQDDKFVSDFTGIYLDIKDNSSKKLSPDELNKLSIDKMSKESGISTSEVKSKLKSLKMI